MVVHAYNGCVWERVPASCDLWYTMSSCQIRGWGASWTTGFQELEKRMKGSKTHFIFPIEWRPWLDRTNGVESTHLWGPRLIGRAALQISQDAGQGIDLGIQTGPPFLQGLASRISLLKTYTLKFNEPPQITAWVQIFHAIICSFALFPYAFFFFLSFHQILIRWAGRKLSLFDR